MDGQNNAQELEQPERGVRFADDEKQEVDAEVQQELRDLSISMKKSQVQAKRLENFSFEPVSLPPSRVQYSTFFDRLPSLVSRHPKRRHKTHKITISILMIDCSHRPLRALGLPRQGRALDQTLDAPLWPRLIHPQLCTHHL